MPSKIKIYNNPIIFFKIKNIYIWKFQCTSLMNFLFDDALFYLFYFDIDIFFEFTFLIFYIVLSFQKSITSP
jgi:hypothetical protein